LNEVLCYLQVIQYYRTALSCATLAAGWEKDVTKCADIIKLARQLSVGKLSYSTPVQKTISSVCIKRGSGKLLCNNCQIVCDLSVSAITCYS